MTEICECGNEMTEYFSCYLCEKCWRTKWKNGTK